MIVKEFLRNRTDGVPLYRTYSDMGMMIKQNQTGVLYSEAVDVGNSPLTYTETGIPIEKDQTIEEKVEAMEKKINNLVAPTESAYTASRNYVKGALVNVCGTLYKATVNIARGDMIIPNKNVTATTLSNAISEVRG